jgi:hypothetical protein
LVDHHEWPAEIMGYCRVLTGAEEAPLQGVHALMELSNAYLARATEMEMTILAAERTGVVKRGDSLYRFRTGELRSFIELCVKCQEVGSRRITMAINQDQARYR